MMDRGVYNKQIVQGNKWNHDWRGIAGCAADTGFSTVQNNDFRYRQ